MGKLSDHHFATNTWEKYARKFPDSLSNGKLIDLVIGSPPYANKGERYPGHVVKWTPKKWTAWMSACTGSMLQITGGKPVVWVVNGPNDGGQYIPCIERLIVVMHDCGYPVLRPVIWTKNARGGKTNWLTNAWEYVIAFGKVGTFNWESIASPPKYKSGGRYSHRDNRGKKITNGGAYPKVKLARPRDIIHATVGGGHMGDKFAHEGEAAYPEKLIEPLIKLLTNEGDTVLDPFCGTGTTAKVCARFGRKSIGVDARASQTAVARRRLRAYYKGNK